MLKKIIETVGTRFLVAIVNIFLLIFNAKTLGVEGVGTIGLVLAVSLLVVVINDIFCGGGLAFLVPKHEISQLLFFPLSLSFFSSLLACLFLFYIGVLSSAYFLYAFFLSLIFTINSVGKIFLVGKQCIHSLNVAELIQPFFMLLLLTFSFFVFKLTSVQLYLQFLFFSYLLSSVYSFFQLSKFFHKQQFSIRFSLLKKIVFYGFFNQLASVAQQLNYRLNYFLIQKYLGLGSLGRYDAATKISESSWLISRSVASVGLSVFANSDDKVYAQHLCLSLLKITLLCVFSFLFVLLIIPDAFYTDYLFSQDFYGIKNIILALALGIISMAGTGVLSSYFSGTGLIYHNTISAFVGLFILFVAGYFFIPIYGLIGAGMSCSASYFFSFLYLLFVFSIKNNIPFSRFLPSKTDYLLLKEKLNSLKEN